MNTTILRDVKKGDYVKRKVDANTVYVRGEYDRASKSYSLIDCNDMNREVFVKSNKIVFVDFTY